MKRCILWMTIVAGVVVVTGCSSSKDKEKKSTAKEATVSVNGYLYRFTSGAVTVVSDTLDAEDYVPVAGATVSLPGRDVATKTDEDGYFWLDGVPVGVQHLLVLPGKTGEGFAPSLFPVLATARTTKEVDPSAIQEVHILSTATALAPGEIVQLRAYTGAGESVREVIDALQWSVSHPDQSEQVGQIDAAGRFRATHPGIVHISAAIIASSTETLPAEADSDGEIEHTSSVEPAPVETEPDTAVEPKPVTTEIIIEVGEKPVSLHGTVRDSDGQPVSGAVVLVDGIPGLAMTDGHGEFVIEGAPDAVALEAAAYRDGKELGRASVQPVNEGVRLASVTLTAALPEIADGLVRLAGVLTAPPADASDDGEAVFGLRAAAATDSEVLATVRSEQLDLGAFAEQWVIVEGEKKPAETGPPSLIVRRVVRLGDELQGMFAGGEKSAVDEATPEESGAAEEKPAEEADPATARPSTNTMDPLPDA